MDHSELVTVSVSDGHLPSVLNKICDYLCSLSYSSLLLRKICSESIMAESQYKSFLCHKCPFLSFIEFDKNVTVQ